MNELIKNKLKLSEATVIATSNKTLDSAGKITITVRDDQYFITSISTRDDVEINKGDKVLVIENLETSIPFMLRHGKTNIFSSLNEKYNNDSIFIHLLIIMPFGCMIGISTIFISLKMNTANSYYKDDKLMKPMKFGLILYVMALTFSCLFAFFIIDDKILGTTFSLIAIILSACADFIIHKANRHYFINLLTNSELLINAHNKNNKP